MCYSHIIIYFLCVFPSTTEKSRTSSAVIKRKHQRTSDESAKVRRHFLGVDVQTSRPVTAPGCQKTLARQRNARNNTLIWCVYKMLRHLGQKWSNKHRTIVHPPPKKKRWKDRKRRFADPLLVCVLHLSQHTDLHLIDCRSELYTLGETKLPQYTHTHTHTLKEVLVIIIIRVERRPNII